jgi:ElaB/YqjD/DUF883 family membrane-anchored ribosome-binding protein
MMMATSTAHNVRSAAAATEQTANGISDAARIAGSAVRDASHRVADAANSAASNIAGAASTVGARASEAAQEFSHRVERQPLTSVLIAAGAGFVIGLVLGRR